MPTPQHAAQPASAPASRPEVSIYWKPGCSSCLKLKEFVEDLGIPFESVNMSEQPERMEEITAAGFRGVPIVRRGDTYSYAQSLDDVAALLGVSRSRHRLPQDTLIERWEQILNAARAVVQSFSEDMLTRPAIIMRDRPIKDLCSHVFQIPEAFMKTVDDGIADTRELTTARAEIVTRDQLLAYVDAALERYREWRRLGRDRAIPERLTTFYGNQPSSLVLERAVWHSAQHARQLDVIAAGSGAEYQIPPALYEGLPMPKRLWM